QRQALEIREALARPDPRQGAPLVTRKLAAQVVYEPGLVGLRRRQRERDDQVRDVVRAVLRDRKEEEREGGTRIVVQPPDQAEVEQRQPAVGRQEDVSAMRVRVVK